MTGRTIRRTLPAALLLVSLALPGEGGHSDLPSNSSSDQTAGRGADALFAEARELARAGERERARALCRRVLERSPGYHDVRVLLARLHAWDGERDAARRQLHRVLDEAPDHADARVALADVELWSDRPAVALEVVERGLEARPGDAALLVRRAEALADLDRDADALAAAERALAAEPGSQRTRRLRRRLLDEVLRNKIGLTVGYETFDDSTDRWLDASLDYRRRYGFGSLLWRLNWADRFDESGIQVEMDAYPRIASRTYLYLNLGLSGDDLFPDLRYAAEVYHNFPHGWEGSLGFRRLEFDETEVTIYTGTVARYVGRWWISLRPNHVDKSDGDSSRSAGLTARRFFGGSRYEYLELRASAGSGDEEIAPDDPLAAVERETLDSASLAVEWNRRIRPRWILQLGAGWRREEFAGDRERDSLTLGAGLERFF